MSQEELEKAIAKYKARKSKARLAYYSLTITLFLAVSALATGLTLPNLLTVCLILPLPLYFTFECLKLTRKLQKLKTRSIELTSLVSTLEAPRFSLASFITQPGLAFRFSLILLLMICFTTLARLRAESSTLSYQVINIR
jgi:hypothetical protein